jgi:hypothetical protein
VAEFLKLAWRRAAPPLEWALRIKWRYLFPAFLLSLYLAMEAVDRITRINLMSGVYDSESDSIDIAIFGAEFAAVELFVLTSLGLGLAHLKWVRYLGIGVLALAALRSFGAACYWTRPDHWWIVAAHVPEFLMCSYFFARAFFVWRDVRHIPLRVINDRKEF